MVSPLDIEESGVDPIGLRQLNLDLMDATVPGINNTTMHIRPYAFMAWTWAKARDVLSAGGEVHSTQFEDLVARYETFYAWAHSLAGAPLGGASAVRKFLPLRGAGDQFLFAGPKWEDFKKRRLSFMAPTQYGPSIKALRVLTATDGGAFRVCTEFAAAVAENRWRRGELHSGAIARNGTADGRMGGSSAFGREASRRVRRRIRTARIPPVVF